ncbi:hypothetical protein F5B21DRAFT_503532 [Xylaria acuta]|nr:hypothetical protein F5B21DRAFT_503532 [Xylaria acuta]
MHLELVAWLLGGKFVEHFKQMTRSYDSRLHIDADTLFYIKSGETTEVKDSMTEYTQYLHEFLELIECGMLIIEPKARVGCGRPHGMLNGTFEKYQNEDYAMKAAPTPGAHGTILTGQFAESKSSYRVRVSTPSQSLQAGETQIAPLAAKQTYVYTARELHNEVTEP